MRQIDIIVDDRGRIWEAHGAALYEQHKLIGSKSDLLSYLIRNCGHIKITKPQYSSEAHVIFYSGRIGARAVTTSLHVLMSAEINTTYVEFLGPLPSMEVYRDFDEIAALFLYHTNDDCNLKRPKFYRETISIKRLTTADPALQPLRKAYRQWEKLHGVMDDATKAPTIFAGQHYTALIRKDRATFERIGIGYPNLRPLISNAQGKDVSAQPDKAYGDWVTVCLLEAARHDEPIFELVEVDVVVSGQLIRSRYQRLLLPWVTARGLVISSSSVTLSAFRSLSAT